MEEKRQRTLKDKDAKMIIYKVNLRATQKYIIACNFLINILG